MSQDISGNKLIAKNATMLYVRMFFTLAISFYSSRIVLKSLGVSDYGIYNVVGGVISMINVLTSSLDSATSRFLTYSLGINNLHNLRITFSTAYYIHFILAVVFLLLSETIGLWFVNTQLVLPVDRMVAANWVYQSAVLSTVLSITQVPYDAAINAHERMGAFAYLQVFKGLLKLGIAFVVLIAIIDHLILYSILYVVLSIVFLLYYRYYCKKNFSECSLILVFKKALFKQMFSFSVWNLFGNIANTFRDQGLNILINRFFGTLLNAAAGVAGQVMAILSAFAGNITLAFHPQIVKEYAVENYSRFNYLICMGTKFQALVCILSIAPVFFNLNFLMGIWLDVVPPGTVILCQVLLVNTIFFCFSSFISYGIIATGRVKNVNISLGCFNLISVILFYLTLKFTDSYVYTYMMNILVSSIYTLSNVIILKRNLSDFDILDFFLHTISPLLLVGICSILLSWIISLCPIHHLLQLLLALFVCTFFTCVIAYKYLLDSSTRNFYKKYILRKIHH